MTLTSHTARGRQPADRREARATLDDPRWAQVLARDPKADDHFFYSVDTTGVFCRPSCGARTPRPEHVRFHNSAAAALAAGFRPCRRCRPDLPPLADRQAALVAGLCRRIEASESPLTLQALAKSSSLSPHYLHRVFKAVTGLTPRAYGANCRARRLREALSPGRAGPSVTEAIYEAGYPSGSRFYEESDRVLGMAPRTYRAGGAGVTIRFAIGQCSLGAILVAATDRGLCAILIGDEPEPLLRDLEDMFPRADLLGGDADFEHLVARVVGFVEAPRLGLDLPLDIQGTVFQQRVWAALRDIPPGCTLSYADLARKIGMPAAVRAAARACASNRLAVAIPCHRVLRQDGGLAGYRWGVDRKRILLEREHEEDAA
ncbi:bifunctional DNA-binding transcriptional regulator/O6-methylguanine-DNA methyltransferase Ada [Castellaniella sp. GW247-6E4]|uniref:bifunctional DNA-binding transcriptional regulator/O6-methylguanine-DNA methyltransferase Ada n=1 Tax=Castellaniella sp. GW247-6E4 TaxID=3140380 RepID=UPI003315D8F1